MHAGNYQHTARFVCTTDEDMCQIGSFYAGAMSNQRRRLGGVGAACGGGAPLRLPDSLRTRPSRSPG
jgi:adenosine kinase